MVSESNPQDGSIQRVASKMPTELLTVIFWKNVDDINKDESLTGTTRKDMFSKRRALTHTWRSAQVCRRWRQILLDMPNLWGRVIDVSLFRQRDNNWMDEIIKRTKNSQLYIKGRAVNWIKFEYILNLLHRTWEERLCFLDLCVQEWHQGQADVLLDIVGRTPKYLKSFNIEDIYPTHEDEPPLIALEAPSLTKFHWNVFGFDFGSPWLSQLGTLEINTKGRVELLHMVFALEQMRQLEVLKLERCNIIVDPTDLGHQAKVPKLRHITLDNLIPMTAGALLDSILPAPGCTISVRTSHLPYSRKEFTEFYAPFSRYFKDYLKHHSLRYLFVSLLRGQLMVTDSTEKTRTALASSFSLHINFIVHPFTLVDMDHVFSAFLQPESFLSNLTHLEATVFLHRQCSPDFNLLRHLSKLDALEVLTAGIHTLDDLLDGVAQLQERGVRNIFPTLHTLQLYSNKYGIENVAGFESYERDDPDTSDYTPYELTMFRRLHDFFCWRRDIGVPIDVLDLTLLQNYSCDLLFLELEPESVFTGLKVMWYVDYRKRPEDYREYTCGSGTPERLQFSCTPAPRPIPRKANVPFDDFEDEDGDDDDFEDDLDGHDTDVATSVRLG